jgi:hypothetical protein
MQRSAEWLIDIAFLLAIVCLTVFWAVPWKEKSVPVPILEMEETIMPAPSVGERDMVPVAEIAGLLGLMEHAPQTPEVTPADDRPSEKAWWIRPMGYAVDEDGRKRYIFKNEKSGAVLSLSIEEVSRGVRLVEVVQDGFVIELEDRRLLVERGGTVR